MYNYIGTLLFSFLLVTTQAANCRHMKDTAMNDALTISVTCEDNPQCLYTKNEDLFIDIGISNPGQTAVGFPLEFVKDRGPIIKVTDTRRKDSINLPTHPADGSLRDKLVIIEPGKAISMKWVIKPAELEQFRNYYVDVSAEVSILADIVVSGKKVEFLGSNTVRIVSKEHNQS
jgi:hypothetical protein